MYSEYIHIFLLLLLLQTVACHFYWYVFYNKGYLAVNKCDCTTIICLVCIIKLLYCKMFPKESLHLLCSCSKNNYLWTKPRSCWWSTWARCFINLLSLGVESLHWPFWMGLSNMLENSVLLPKKLGLTQSTIHQYSIRLFWRG